MKKDHIQAQPHSHGPCCAQEQSHCREQEHHHHHDECADACCTPHGGGLDEIGCSCHSHGKDNEKKEARNTLIKLGISASLFAGALFVPLAPVQLALYFISYIIISYDVFITAGKHIAKGQVFDENFLMLIATIGAFLIREYPEAVAVMLFYQTGEFFQDLAVSRSKKNISQLMDIRPDSANLLCGEEITVVSPRQVTIGDTILIKPGEKVPLDATVLDGSCSLDTAALTGESLPRAVQPGDDILSGCINLSGTIRARVTASYGDSTVSKILELMESSSAKKSKTENFITRFAKYYTPAVVALAALIAVVPSLIDGDWAKWVERGLSFLVVSCPCALVISVPLSFFGGIGGASKAGILVKGSNYLEALSKVDTVVFDKTGTLTAGKFSIAAIHSEIEDNKLLEIAAHCEIDSSHPISVSIKQAYGKELSRAAVSEVQEIAGLGVSAKLDGTTYYAGNEKLMKQIGAAYVRAQDNGTVVYVAAGSRFLGSLVVADTIKDDTREGLAQLRALGIRNTVMLTGDNGKTGAYIAGQLDIDRAFCELLPGDKVEKVEQLIAESGTVAFVGDGINDAPVLAMADVGVAMGGVGSDAAIQAADIVIMNDKITKLAQGIKISRNTLKIVKENIIIALGIKFLILALVAVGLGSMWMAVFADVGVALIAILNALRALKVKE